ncbi:hypothetical protein ASPCADRAFT_206275 [Aspergillus carbonarius ITEM 5010]|uniref:Uncharacterized protein n=1 Tax=Aspergillus carbonarius (strain ITEM 5010) TaxID=602072 RepID=A0A1R3RSH5_ASPC5|nr:hypothetical protein ASPCADRAFT_206275 [Aspergillus carbonarius ITEM 5010]
MHRAYTQCSSLFNCTRSPVTVSVVSVQAAHPAGLLLDHISWGAATDRATGCVMLPCEEIVVIGVGVGGYMDPAVDILAQRCEIMA